MKQFLVKTLPGLFLLTLVVVGVGRLSFKVIQPAYAIDPVEELQQQIDELEKLKKLSEAATKPLESQLKDLKVKIANVRAGINAAKEKSQQLAKQIQEREADLSLQYKILAKRINEQYKRERVVSLPFLAFFQLVDTKNTRDLAYRASVKAQDERIINDIVNDISKLETDKRNLEERQEKLAKMEKQFNSQVSFFEKEIGKAKSYQKELSNKIAELSAKQKAIIAARSGTQTTSVGEVALADDFNASIAYKAQAPANSFAVFSFGAYTHRNGMSQYGAKARAEAGQSVEEILKAYYPNATLKKDYPEMSSIKVDGVGTVAFEDQYLQGIYEMPASWHLNALKAQAIAARTYAIRYTNNGQKAICTNERCQVFKNQKKGGDWEKAVNETRGWVLVDGTGNPVSTQYASTHGGYTNTSGWDTTDKSGKGNWADRAWENKAKSPWFYKAWYRAGYSKSGASCGRNHPWLSQREFADIINAWIVQKNPNGADTSRIQPVTINQCNIGGGGGNPYSIDELKALADKSGGAVTSISSVTVSHSTNGQTVNIHLETNCGAINIPGSEFKTIFNLRAPGYLRIPQSRFAFFNIEHKK